MLDTEMSELPVTYPSHDAWLALLIVAELKAPGLERFPSMDLNKNRH